MIFISKLIYVSSHFWSFISSCNKIINHERPNYHHIVKIDRISLQIGNMKLRVLNPNPNTNNIFAKLLLGSQKSIRKVSVFKTFLLTPIKTLILPINQKKITALSQKYKVQVFLGTPFIAYCQRMKCWSFGMQLLSKEGTACHNKNMFSQKVILQHWNLCLVQQWLDLHQKIAKKCRVIRVFWVFW